MDKIAALCSLVTAIISILLVVAFARASWREDSRSTRSRRSSGSAPTLDSDEASALRGKVTRLEGEMAELYSTLEKLTTTLRRLSSRQGMRDLREKPDVPPVGAPKAELRKHFGVNGLNGPQQAALQQKLEANKHGQGD